MSTTNTQQTRTSRTVSRDAARQAVEFAQEEVYRAECRCEQVERDYRRLLESSHAYLCEAKRKLRVAEMQLRQQASCVVCQPVDPAPWLAPDREPPLMAWRSKITVDAARVSDD